MPGDIPIRVETGTLEVETMSGHINDQHLFLYVTLREKHAHAEVCAEDGDTTIIEITATPKTLRATADGEDYEKIDPEKEKATLLHIGGGYVIEASVSRYTLRIVGIKPPREGMLYNVAFERVK